jgi:hypothetical protein
MTTESSKSGVMLGRAGTSASLYVALWVIKLVEWIPKREILARIVVRII